MKDFKLDYLMLLILGSLLYLNNILFDYLKFLKNNYLINILLALFTFLIFFIYYKFKHKESIISYFNFDRRIIKNVFVILGLVFPLALFGRLINPEFDLAYGKLNDFTNILSILIFLSLMFFVIIREEIIQRLLQRRISLSFGSFISIIILSINFSLYHFNFYSLFGLKTSIIATLSIFITSILIAILFEKTKSIALTIFAHFLINFFIISQISLTLNGFFEIEIIFWILWFVLFIYALFKFKDNFIPLNLTFYDIDIYKFLFILLFALSPILILFIL
jgi:membrane protease YdiL (CAAX protease family)